jgi:hypothetical protein
MHCYHSYSRVGIKWSVQRARHRQYRRIVSGHQTLDMRSPAFPLEYPVFQHLSETGHPGLYSLTLLFDPRDGGSKFLRNAV